MQSLFGRHGREFAHAIQAREYDRTPEGVWFPRQGALLRGEFEVRTRHGSIRQHNLLTYGGLSQIGLLVLGTGIGIIGWAMAPYGANDTPTALWNDLDLYLAGELGDAPEGYDEGSRVAWGPVDEGARVLGNTASPSAFTLRTATSIDVYGFALSDTTSGKLSGQPTSPVDITVVDSEPGPAIFTARGAVRRGFASSLGTELVWLDPAGDDVWDAGLGHMVDNAGDAIQLDVSKVDHTDTYNDATVVAACRFDTPLTFNDFDPLNVTYRIQL